MSVNPKTLVEKLIEDSKGRKRLAQATSALAVAAVLITVGVLTFPAISISGSDENLREQGIDINVNYSGEEQEQVAPPSDEAPIVALDQATEAQGTEQASDTAAPITEETNFGEVATSGDTVASEGTDAPVATEAAEGEAVVEGEAQAQAEAETETPAIPELTEEQLAAQAEAEAAKQAEAEAAKQAAEAEAAAQLTYSEAAAAALATADLGSNRLIVGTNDQAIAQDANLVASFDNVYLLQYANIEEATKGFLTYFDTAEYVTPDVALAVADEEDTTDPQEYVINTENVYTEEENPFAELETALAEETTAEADAAAADVQVALIALIDTGAAVEGNVVEAVSMLGADATDENGHGQRMVSYITEENEAAQILSIKALGADGKGDASAVIAAMNYAMERGANIINLSASAYANEENAALAEAVKRAEEAGIVVVGAAGNNGFNAKFYIPGNIEEATIVGAADEQGQRIKQSNFGETVDYNVFAGSTSEAAARMSGFVSVYGEAGIAEVLNQGKIFTTDYVAPVAEEETEEEATEGEGEEGAEEAEGEDSATSDSTADDEQTAPSKAKDKETNFTTQEGVYINTSIPAHAAEAVNANTAGGKVYSGDKIILTAKVYDANGGSLANYAGKIGFRAYDEKGVALGSIGYIDADGIVNVDTGHTFSNIPGTGKVVSYSLRPVSPVYSEIPVAFNKSEITYSFKRVFASPAYATRACNDITFTVALPPRTDEGIILQSADINTSEDERAINIVKRGITGETVEGAILQIKDENGTVIYEWETSANPYVAVLKTNKSYVVHEVSAPDNYELADDVAIAPYSTARINYFGQNKIYSEIGGKSTYSFCVDFNTGNYTSAQTSSGVYANAVSASNLGDLTDVDNLPTKYSVGANMQQILYILKLWSSADSRIYDDNFVPDHDKYSPVSSAAVATQFAIWTFSNNYTFSTIAGKQYLSERDRPAVKEIYDKIISCVEQEAQSWSYANDASFTAALYTAPEAVNVTDDSLGMAAQPVIVPNPPAQTIVMVDRKPNDTTQVQEGNFKITASKLAEDGTTPLPGAKLQIVMKKDGVETVVAPVFGDATQSHDTTESNPWEVTLESYDNDATYYLREIEAPDGYMIAEDVEIKKVEENRTYLIGQKPQDVKLQTPQNYVIETYNTAVGHRVGNNVVYCLDNTVTHDSRAFANRINLSDITSSTNMSNAQNLSNAEVQEYIKRAIYVGYPNNKTGLFEELKKRNSAVNDQVFEELTSDFIHFWTNGYDPEKDVYQDPIKQTGLIKRAKSKAYIALFNYMFTYITTSQYYAWAAAWGSFFELNVYWNGDNQPMIDTEIIEYSAQAEMIDPKDGTSRVIVTKEWNDAEGVSLPEVTFTLYRTTDKQAYDAYLEAIKTNPAAEPPSSKEPVSQLTLPTADGLWTDTFHGLSVKNEEGQLYYYFVTESTASNYTLSSTSQDDVSTSTISATTIKTIPTPASWRALGTSESLVAGHEYVIGIANDGTYKSILVSSNYTHYDSTGTPLTNFETKSISSPDDLETFTFNGAYRWTAIDAGNGRVYLQCEDGYLKAYGQTYYAALTTNISDASTFAYENGKLVNKSNNNFLTIAYGYVNKGSSRITSYLTRFASPGSDVTVYERTPGGDEDQETTTNVEYVSCSSFTFTNDYIKPKELPTSIVFKAKKSLTGTGEDLTSDTYKNAFTFTLKDSQGKVIQSINNNGEEINFTEIKLTAEGSYVYYITEEKPTSADPYMTYDLKKRKITVNVEAQTSDNVTKYVITSVTAESEDGATYASTYTDVTPSSTNDKIIYNVEVQDPIHNSYFKPEIEILKLDSTGAKIGGATLQIKNEAGEVLESWTSVAGQAHKVEAQLVVGESYVLHEENPPSGYQLASDVSFTVLGDDGENTKTEVVMFDPKEGEILITKRNHEGIGLLGAVLEIHNEDGETVYGPWKSDGEAHKVTEKLPAGTYYIHEVTAPDHYRLSPDKSFTVDSSGNTEMPFTGSGTFHVVNEVSNDFNTDLKVYYNGEPHKAYCLYKGEGSTTYDSARRTTLTSLPSDVPNADKIKENASSILHVAWIGYPNDAAGLLKKYQDLDKHDEHFKEGFDEYEFIMATQAVIWHFTNDFELGENDTLGKAVTDALYKEMLTMVKEGKNQPPAGADVNIYYESSTEQPVLEPYFSSDGKSQSIDFVNKPFYDLHLLKVRSDSNVMTYVDTETLEQLAKRNYQVTPTLKDAKFSFKNEATGKYLNAEGGWVNDVVELSTDENGVIDFKNLEPGTYILSELEAPEGYQGVSGAYWTINIVEKEEENNKLTHSITVTPHAKSDGCTVNETTGVVCIANELERYTLPATGGVGTTVFVVAGSMLMVLAAVLYVRRTSRKEV